jgi:hypothetical protein
VTPVVLLLNSAIIILHGNRVKNDESKHGVLIQIVIGNQEHILDRGIVSFNEPQMILCIGMDLDIVV